MYIYVEPWKLQYLQHRWGFVAPESLINIKTDN